MGKFISAVGDGNCAYNAFAALFVENISYFKEILNKKSPSPFELQTQAGLSQLLIDWNEQYKNNTFDNLEDLFSHLESQKTSEKLQRALAPVLRKLAVEQLKQEETEKIQAEIALKKFRNNLFDALSEKYKKLDSSDSDHANMPKTIEGLSAYLELKSYCNENGLEKEDNQETAQFLAAIKCLEDNIDNPANLSLIKEIFGIFKNCRQNKNDADWHNLVKNIQAKSKHHTEMIKECAEIQTSLKGNAPNALRKLLLGSMLNRDELLSEEVAYEDWRALHSILTQGASIEDIQDNSRKDRIKTHINNLNSEAKKKSDKKNVVNIKKTLVQHLAEQIGGNQNEVAVDALGSSEQASTSTALIISPTEKKSTDIENQDLTNELLEASAQSFSSMYLTYHDKKRLIINKAVLGFEIKTFEPSDTPGENVSFEDASIFHSLIATPLASYIQNGKLTFDSSINLPSKTKQFLNKCQEKIDDVVNAAIKEKKIDKKVFLDEQRQRFLSNRSSVFDKAIFEAMEEWEASEKEKYFDEIAKPASGLSSERWGSDHELEVLGNLFGVKVYVNFDLDVPDRSGSYQDAGSRLNAIAEKLGLDRDSKHTLENLIESAKEKGTRLFLVANPGGHFYYYPDNQATNSKAPSKHSVATQGQGKTQTPSQVEYSISSTQNNLFYFSLGILFLSFILGMGAVVFAPQLAIICFAISAVASFSAGLIYFLSPLEEAVPESSNKKIVEGLQWVPVEPEETEGPEAVKEELLSDTFQEMCSAFNAFDSEELETIPKETEEDLAKFEETAIVPSGDNEENQSNNSGSAHSDDEHPSENSSSGHSSGSEGPNTPPRTPSPSC